MFLLGNKAIAEAQNPIALFYLGIRYKRGIGEPQNLFKAFECYKSASEKGLTRAKNALAFCYSYGEGVKKNVVEANRWNKLATDSGRRGEDQQFYFGEALDVDSARNHLRALGKKTKHSKCVIS